MKFLKKHLIEIIIFIIFFGIVIFGLTSFLMLWNSGSGNKYGNRLNGISKVELGDQYLNDTMKKIKENEIVNKVNSNITGRIIKYIITVNNGTDLNKAKELTKVVVESLEEDELEFYDVQVYLLEENANEESKYPKIGYKHKTSESFVWSNN
jgi:hypothetical protein